MQTRINGKIDRCSPEETIVIHEIINDAARAYEGHIPADRWHDPYMDLESLQWEINDGVVFWGYYQNDILLGIMGIQDKGEVTLIRHAYVRTAKRHQGIGGTLLNHLRALTENPLLIGTWKAAVWAIGFYRKHGFCEVDEFEKNRLLTRYWTIPARQVETSTVLKERPKVSA